MGDIFVDHDAFQNFWLFKSSAWDFFNFGVSFDFKVEFVFGSFSHDDFSGFDGKVGDKFTPSGGELGTDTVLKGTEYLFVIGSVNGLWDVRNDLFGEI